MAALKISDLDRNAKHAILVLACRANRYTAMAEVSIPAVAADMGVGDYAARHALDRAVKAGYLAVDKSTGRAPLWQLTPAVKTADLPRDSEQQGPRSDRGPGPRSRPRTKDSLDTSKERAVASPEGDGAGENLPAAGPAFAGHAHRLRLIRNLSV